VAALRGMVNDRARGVKAARRRSEDDAFRDCSCARRDDIREN
jgi:hypothetical protein